MRVLFLVTRFPAPPRRGDQVRAYHHLRLLAGRHQITCAALVTRKPGRRARAEIEAMGVRVVVLPVGCLRAAGRAAVRVLRGDPRPVQVLLYARRRTQARVVALAAGADVVHAQLVRSLAYLPARRPPATVVDLIDALSENFARRARNERRILAPFTAWEAGRLARAERELVQSGAPCLVVSEAERAALGGGKRIVVVPNGVDPAAFAYRENGRRPGRLVFGGNLGYFPNVKAAKWLVRDILPRVRAAVPETEVRLVGARPSFGVRALAARPRVSLAASVPAMAPELAEAAVAVIPLRTGSGLQNKVLEAMAVGTPVVATPLAIAGLAVEPGEHLLVADDAAGLAAATVTLLRDPEKARRLARAARALVERRYRWEDSAAGVEAAWSAAAAP